MILRILRRSNRMLDGVPQCIVVDSVPISAFYPLPAMICVSVDLRGRRKWRLRRPRVRWVFAFYGYPQLPKSVPDLGLPFDKGAFVGDAGVVCCLFVRQDEGASASGNQLFHG
ncbi:hypothetical protein AWC25_24065 [Mycobacterium sherrisii]|nr:hypothetical protein AWC25_24065 [Mycobacterium sherrisii]